MLFADVLIVARVPKAEISRYGVVTVLGRSRAGRGGEIQLTDAIARVQQREKVWAYEFDGLRYDCGSKLGYLEANVELGKRHPEIGAAFRRYLRTTTR